MSDASDVCAPRISIIFNWAPLLRNFHEALSRPIVGTFQAGMQFFALALFMSMATVLIAGQCTEMKINFLVDGCG